MAQLVTVQLIQRIFCKESKSLGKYLKCVASNLLHGACTNYKVKVAMKNYLFFNENCEEKKTILIYYLGRYVLRALKVPRKGMPYFYVILLPKLF